MTPIPLSHVTIYYSFWVKVIGSQILKKRTVQHYLQPHKTNFKTCFFSHGNKASEEELAAAAAAAPKTVKPKKTACKAVPKPKVSKTDGPLTDTPMKDGKRCKKVVDQDPPEDTPEATVVVHKRHRLKTKDPDSGEQIRLLKEVGIWVWCLGFIAIATTQWKLLKTFDDVLIGRVFYSLAGQCQNACRAWKSQSVPDPGFQ